MITVGIPTYNEERVIANSIFSVLPQISKDDEVIVVASGCTDDTVFVIQSIMKKDKRVKLIIEKRRKGKSSAINLIIKHAKGDIIVQTDGDVIVEQGAIDSLLDHFKNKEVGAVSGKPIPIIPTNNLFYDWTVMTYNKIGVLREKEVQQGTFWHLSGYLLAFRKDALMKVPFAKGAVDAWMGRIIKDNGYLLTYEPNAKVFVNAPLTVEDFINQKARVRAGFFNLPKSPRTVKGEIFYLPKELFNLNPLRWPKFIISGFVYLYSWIKGYYMARTNKSLEQIWKVSKSTKR